MAKNKSEQLEIIDTLKSDMLSFLSRICPNAARMTIAQSFVFRSFLESIRRLDLYRDYLTQGGKSENLPLNNDTW